ALLEESLSLRPEDTNNVLSYANTVSMYLEVPDALAIVDGLIQSHPELGDLLIFKSWLLSDQWAYADALAAVQQALALAKEQDGELTWYYWQQYDIQTRMGDFAQALKSLNRALSPSDELANYLERVDLQMWHLHNLPAALEDLNALASKYGNDAQILYLRTLVHLRLEQYEEARADADAVTGDEALALFLKGICALYEEKAGEAAEAMDAFLAQSPDDLAGLLYRAILAISLEDDLPATVDFAQRAIAVDPQSADAYRLLGEAYEDMGQWTQAETAYRLRTIPPPPFPSPCFCWPGIGPKRRWPCWRGRNASIPIGTRP
ncbi:MAG TPA: tetratricopeptide repeat protein, partial [Clostridia bacterium]|nr:tetratricopeptide repeat protein [Clostridia bacterium]